MSTKLRCIGLRNLLQVIRKRTTTEDFFPPIGTVWTETHVIQGNNPCKDVKGIRSWSTFSPEGQPPVTLSLGTFVSSADRSLFRP